MASAGDGEIGEGAEEATPARNRRTIYDYLGEGEEDGTEEEASPASPDTPPRLRLPAFTCARIPFGRLGRKRGGRGGRKEAAAAEKSEDASVDSSGWKQPAAGTSSGDGGGEGGSVAAGGQTGMGLSMLFLLARTCVELNRMAEVRAQMEAHLTEVRDEASRVKGAGDPGDHVVLVTPKACNNDNLQSSSTTSTTTSTASSSSCVSDDTSTANRLVEIRRREDDGERASEAELETEPPARLRQPPEYNKCDTENDDTPDQCSVQSWSSSSSDGEFIELEGGRFGAGGGNPQRGAVLVDESDDDDESCERRREGGVSAAELERRLHELQHRRDRERIEALETALRRARRRLTEKEMEARLWQDTATLALGQPVPRDGRQ